MIRLMGNTNQELFNIAYIGMKRQGRLATMRDVDRPLPICAYRTDSGLACVAGQAIPNDQYHPDIEGSCIEALVVNGYVEISPKVTQDFIRRLQACHDDSVHPETTAEEQFAEFLERMEQLAFEYDLTIPTDEEVFNGV